VRTYPLIAFAALFVLSSCASAPPAASMADPAAAVSARFGQGIEAFNRHDLDVFLAQFGDDIEMHTPTGWLRGKEAVRARFVETFAQFPRVRMETEQLRARVAAPGVVIIDFAWRVFPAGQGPAFHGLSSGLYVQRAGRWVEIHEHESVTRIDAPLPGARP
jgi:uncharacterized protein (TIGR02246 family)